jgi:hypothetical protein
VRRPVPPEDAAKARETWSKDGGDQVHESNFAPGADDGKLALPELAAKAK